jgi:hypothetical protein
VEKAVFIYNPLSGRRRLPLKLDYIIKKFSEKDILLLPYRISGLNNDNYDRLIDIIKQEDVSHSRRYP